MSSSPPPPQRLPFEPKSSKKKPAKVPPSRTTNQETVDRSASSLQSIPDDVSKRMIKRMALFSGIPTGLGMVSFVAFYWVVSQGWLEIPTFIVFAVSLGLFGLGVLGLSYGIFSTSWEEDNAGHWWGWQEFKTNVGRTVQAWRSSGKNLKAEK